MDEARVRALNDEPVRHGARYVLYWARSNRRVSSNHALAFAAERANDLGLPLLFYEALRRSDPHSNSRLHTFVVQGVPENARRARDLGFGYVFDLGGDSLRRLAEDAAMVVTDDDPLSEPGTFRAKCYAVDSSCVVPMSEIGERQYAAYAIRPKIRKLLPRYLRPLEPVRVRRDFRGDPGGVHTEVTAENIRELVAACDIDHSVPAVASVRGGADEAERRLQEFLEHDLRRYAKYRNEPSEHATSRLSPYLHFGQISALEVALKAREHAAKHKLIADEFLEELIVRRELAFNFARHTATRDSLDVLPDWARATLHEHAHDRRPAVYTREEFVNARTHDELWNATQTEMLKRGTIHSYYRMYWGKKMIEWSGTYGEALALMTGVHDRFALDGQDPNTYANVLWCFGLHDRPWPERPVFGKIRYMSLEGMRRKTDVDAYVREIGAL